MYNLLNVTSNMSTSEIGVVVTVCGLVVVFAMLILLVVIIWLFGKMMSATNNPKKNTEQTVTSKTVSTQTVKNTPNISSTIPDEIVAVIAASIDAMYNGSDKKPVIRSIAKSDKSIRPVWAMAGLYQNTQSF